MSANFHFVISKYVGKLDTTFVSLSQFDNIIMSFNDEKQRTHYFPLLEPYSDLSDIKSEFKEFKESKFLSFKKIILNN